MDCSSGSSSSSCIPEDSKSSLLLPIYKEKGGSYGGNKLLEHAMKVVKRVFEYFAI